MSDLIDADDLAMLAAGFTSVMQASPSAGEADDALYELGWGELLQADPRQGAATAFAALGITNAAAGILDDVLAVSLGAEPSLDLAVVVPAPHVRIAPADGTLVAGLVTPRIDRATTALVAGIDGTVRRVDAAGLRSALPDALDPGQAYRPLRTEIAGESIDTTGGWDDAVGAGRHALAHQLVASARWMLDEAREHALGREQFGRSVASFQAVRHKLAETIVDIEGAASVASAATGQVDPLLDALAKSLAGKAAHTAAKHAQQILAGIGFTDEHRFHLWLKRALVIDTVFGSASSLPGEIGRDLLDAGTAPKLIDL